MFFSNTEIRETARVKPFSPFYSIVMASACSQAFISPQTSPPGHLDADTPCQLDPWKPKDSCYLFSQGDEALTRRGLLLPGPCSLAHGIAEKLETAPGAWLGCGFEAHNNDVVRSSSPGTSLQLSPGLDTEEIQEYQARLLAHCASSSLGI